MVTSCLGKSGNWAEKLEWKRKNWLLTNGTITGVNVKRLTDSTRQQAHMVFGNLQSYQIFQYFKRKKVYLLIQCYWDLL